MRWKQFLSGSALGAAVVAAFVFGGSRSIQAQPQPYARTPEITTPVKPVTDAATVRIELPDGLGSGVAIGNGYILSAAHVVGKSKTVDIKLRDGEKGTADVLWTNEAYDIALLRTDVHTLPATISCIQAKVGAQITAVGNPLGMEFITAYGKIAGDARVMGDKWKSAYVTDMTTVMGASGGPVFDDAGFLIGITVGVTSAPLKTENGYIPSLVGFGFVVPSTVVCELMGRA